MKILGVPSIAYTQRVVKNAIHTRHTVAEMAERSGLTVAVVKRMCDQCGGTDARAYQNEDHRTAIVSAWGDMRKESCK